MWLSSDQAIDHVRARVWWKHGFWRFGPTLSMVARTELQNAFGANSVRVRGPLRFPTPFSSPPERVRWPNVDIAPTFWPDAVWDGREGFRNRSSLEELPLIQVFETDLHARWPVADRFPMPAPFDLDWPQLLQVIDPMTRCLELTVEAALALVIKCWEEKKLKASKYQGSCGRYSFEEWEKEDLNAVRKAHEFKGSAPIVLWADDVIALEPLLVQPYSAWPRASSPALPAPSLTPPAPTSPAAAVALDVPSKGAGMPTSTKVRGPNLAERLAAALRAHFPDGQPPWQFNELKADVMKKQRISRVADRTFRRAMALAWNRNRPGSA